MGLFQRQGLALRSSKSSQRPDALAAHPGVFLLSFSAIDLAIGITRGLRRVSWWEPKRGHPEAFTKQVLLAAAMNSKMRISAARSLGSAGVPPVVFRVSRKTFFATRTRMDRRQTTLCRAGRAPRQAGRLRYPDLACGPSIG